MSLTYKGDFIEKMSEKEFNAGCIKFNIPDKNNIHSSNGEGVWGWVTPEDKEKYNDNTFVGTIKAILCDHPLNYSGILSWGMEVEILCRGDMRATLNPDWVRKNIQKVKNEKVVSNIKGSMSNQKELAFIYPYYSIYSKDSPCWKMNTNPDFVHLRKLAMSVVNKVDSNNKFMEQKVGALTKEDLLLAVQCADEIALVVAKYKKQFLLKEGRDDIVEAFGM